MSPFFFQQHNRKNAILRFPCGNRRNATHTSSFHFVVCFDFGQECTLESAHEKCACLDEIYFTLRYIQEINGNKSFHKILYLQFSSEIILLHRANLITLKRKTTANRYHYCYGYYYGCCKLCREDSNYYCMQERDRDCTLYFMLRGDYFVLF